MKKFRRNVVALAVSGALAAAALAPAAMAGGRRRPGQAQVHRHQDRGGDHRVGQPGRDLRLPRRARAAQCVVVVNL